MSENDRSRLYAWLCEHADEQVAEYMMSCLPAAPVTDLVTKQYLEAVLSAEFSKFALTIAAQREADRAEQAAQREADRAEQAAQREADRAEQAAQRKADRAEQAAQRKADRAEIVAQREDDRTALAALTTEHAAQRKADRAESARQFRWLIGTFIALTGVIIGAMYGVVAIA